MNTMLRIIFSILSGGEVGSLIFQERRWGSPEKIYKQCYCIRNVIKILKSRRTNGWTDRHIFFKETNFFLFPYFDQFEILQFLIQYFSDADPEEYWGAGMTVVVAVSHFLVIFNCSTNFIIYCYKENILKKF